MKKKLLPVLALALQVSMTHAYTVSINVPSNCDIAIAISQNQTNGNEQAEIKSQDVIELEKQLHTLLTQELLHKDSKLSTEEIIDRMHHILLELKNYAHQKQHEVYDRAIALLVQHKQTKDLLTWADLLLNNADLQAVLPQMCSEYIDTVKKDKPTLHNVIVILVDKRGMKNGVIGKLPFKTITNLAWMKLKKIEKEQAAQATAQQVQ